MGILSYLFSSDNKRSIMKIEKIIKQIDALADKYAAMTDEELGDNDLFFDFFDGGVDV